jgi:hypothetical protein
MNGPTDISVRMRQILPKAAYTDGHALSRLI